MHLSQINALLTGNLISARVLAAAPWLDLKIISGHFNQRLRVAKIGSFSGMRKERGLRRIRSSQTKLEQVGCDCRFCIPEIAIRLKKDATACSVRWNQEHADPRKNNQIKYNSLLNLRK